MPATAIILPPPLREGDRLNSDEFIRRWEAMPGLKRAELIDGTVFFIPSPVSLFHSDAQGEVYPWLWIYEDVLEKRPNTHPLQRRSRTAGAAKTAATLISAYYRRDQCSTIGKEQLGTMRI